MISRSLEVSGLLAIIAEVRDSLVLAEVVEHQGPDKVAAQGSGEGLAVCDREVVPDFVVRFALRVAAAARVGGERLTEYRLADLLVAIAGEALIEVGA